MIDWNESPPFGRRVSLQHTLELLHRRRSERVPLIVEVGTSGSYNPDGLGNALLAFAWYAGRYGATVRSVDVQPGAVTNSREILQKYVPEFAHLPEIENADAYYWATRQHDVIDLLYMDAGFEIECDPNYVGFAERHPEIPSFYVELFCQFPPDCWRDGSLLLIDDTDPTSYRGKGIRLIPYLLENGWKKLPLMVQPVFPMALLEKSPS